MGMDFLAELVSIEQGVIALN